MIRYCLYLQTELEEVISILSKCTDNALLLFYSCNTIRIIAHLAVATRTKMLVAHIPSEAWGW